jgi:arylsulfatase
MEPPAHVDGISYLPELLGTGGQKEHPHLYWEYPASGGQQAVRKGPWKAIRKDIHQGNLEIELYNLQEDIQEQQDLAAQYPEIIREMELIMELEHVPATLERFRMEALDGSPETGIN